MEWSGRVLFEGSTLRFEWNIWRRNISGLLVPWPGCELRTYRPSGRKQWRFYGVRTFPLFSEKFKLWMRNIQSLGPDKGAPPLKWVHYAENMFRSARGIPRLYWTNYTASRQGRLVTSLAAAPGSQVTSLCAQWGGLQDCADNSIYSSSRGSSCSSSNSGNSRIIIIIIILKFISCLITPVFTNAFFVILHITA